MIEIWKPLPEWEDLYEVSDQGQVRSLPRPGTSGRVLKQQINPNGYAQVHLMGPGRKNRCRVVHQLVLETFVGPRPYGAVACHGPGGQLDNTAQNLRWASQSENVIDQLRHGTHPSGATLETCGNGHQYTPENTYWKRCCRTCNSRKTGGMEPPAHLELGQQIAGLFTQEGM